MRTKEASRGTLIESVIFCEMNLPVRLIEMPRHVSGQANVSFHVHSVPIWMGCREAENDWSNGQTDRRRDNKKANLRPRRQTGSLTLSDYSFTVQWDIGRCFRKRSRGRVYVSSHRAAERWPLSRVTDYRSLMLPQRLLRLVEMNHPSAFFCKPSITSDFSPQTPDTQLPPPLTHIVTHTY